jgi:hypothetical protein
MRQASRPLSERRRITRLVLMARLIGCDGAPICQEDVQSIECHVRSGQQELADADYAALPFNASVDNGEVISSELITDGWTVDDSGFNFRHDVSPLLAGCFLERPEIEFTVLYRVLLITGEYAIVCFRIRRVSNDRYGTISIDSQPDVGTACHATG